MSRIYSSLSGGELFEKITEEGYTMSEAEVINYMRQVCEGVKHMHERNIIHLGTVSLFLNAVELGATTWYVAALVPVHQQSLRNIREAKLAFHLVQVLPPSR